MQGLLLSNGRTLSRVTRRAGVRKRSAMERRVTFDRAVWTKPLAFAADAVLSAMSFQSYGPRAQERARRPRRSMPDGDDTSRAREIACVAGNCGWRADLRRPRVRARHDDAWRPTSEDYDVSWTMSARSDVR